MTTTEWLQIFMGGKITLSTITATDTRVIRTIATTSYTDAVNNTGDSITLLNSNPTSTAMAVYSAPDYSVSRTFMLFNFASLTATVVSARLYVYNLGQLPIYIRKCNNTGTLIGSDFTNNATTDFGNSSNTILDQLSRTVSYIDLNAAAITEINNKGLIRFVAFCNNDYNLITPVLTGSASYANSAYIELTYA